MEKPEYQARKPELHELIPEDYFRVLRREEIFKDGAPLELDLGCGEGSFLIALAAHHPERRFLGVERLLGRVRKVSRKADEAGLSNVKVLRLETAYTVEWLIPDASVSRVHLLFPDPWPKKKHHRRRLVNARFAEILHRILVPGGEFLFKTDHEEYFDWATEAIDGSGILERLDWATGAFFYPETDFEALWKKEDRRIQGARWKKPEA